MSVTLVHDPGGTPFHTWWATGSVRSTTLGIRLYLDRLEPQADVLALRSLVAGDQPGGRP